MADSFQPPRPFSFLMWLVVIAMFGLFIGAVFLMFRYGEDPAKAEKAIVQARMEKLQSHRDQDKLALENYCWVNEQKKIAGIPIARAMELQVERLKQKTPRAAAPKAATTEATSTNHPSVEKGAAK
jgi:hypothetical protein